MRHQATSLIIRDIPVTDMLTFLRRRANPVKMKDFSVTFP